MDENVRDGPRDDGTQQYLTFSLAGEEYAINVLSIKEVLGVPRITRVPRMPDFMCGVINLRGNIVPLLDLGLKFGVGKTQVGIDTSIIVTEIGAIFDGGEEENFTIGIFSDMVHKVVGLEPSMVEPPPKIGGVAESPFITGMGRVDDSFVMILDINKLLSAKELLQETSTEAAAHE